MLTQALHYLDPERAHKLVVLGLGLGLAPYRAKAGWPGLSLKLAGLELSNPLGLAAGFDKNAEALPGLARLGFGWLEVGTITPRPQAGNPTPRIFRLSKDRAVINRLGFNNQGLEAAKRRLARRKPAFGIVGANIGANKTSKDPIQDYVTCLQELYGLADYFTINVSSPNTPGLRDLQGRRHLEKLLERLMTCRAGLSSEGDKKPLFLKIAPDLNHENETDIAKVALDLGVDALIISNTTLERPDTLLDVAKSEGGGLSGRPLFEKSTRQVRRFRKLTGGRLPLIGVGGIDSGERAYAKILAGASAIQLYTGLIYEGPSLVAKVLQGLVDCLERDGHRDMASAIGAESNAIAA